MAAIQPPRKRVSHEAELLKALQESIADLGVVGVGGQGASNRFGVLDWDLLPSQQFQYGDFRIELPTATVIVETESAGGVGNLVKYWPLLRSGTLTKRLVILHVYMLSSDADYIAHRKLWSFLVDRMAEDLAANGLGRPARWDALLITYRKGGPLDEVTALLRRLALESGDVAAPRSGATAGSDALRVKRDMSTTVHAIFRLVRRPSWRSFDPRPSRAVVSIPVSKLPAPWWYRSPSSANKIRWQVDPNRRAHRARGSEAARQHLSSPRAFLLFPVLLVGADSPGSGRGVKGRRSRSRSDAVGALDAVFVTGTIGSEEGGAPTFRFRCSDRPGFTGFDLGGGRPLALNPSLVS